MPALSGNATYRHTNTTVLCVDAVEAPIVVTSDEFDDRLAETYERLGMRPGLLESVAGISERRWWPDDVSFTDAAALAGAKAIADSGVDAERIGMLIDTSVCKDRLEPSAAVTIHHTLGLSSKCMNFDLANACLGFVNGMHLAANMIDAGHIEYALIVDGEGSRQVQEATLDRLASPETTVDDVFAEFATLTLGSGAAAMVLGAADLHPGGHQLLGGAARAETQHHELCSGTLERMTTDTKGLLEAGVELAEAAWLEAMEDDQISHWSEMDWYVMHQVSAVHTTMLCERLGIDTDRVPITFPTLGNIGPASVPLTLARQTEHFQPGDKILCMGIGSGINTSCTEIHW